MDVNPVVLILLGVAAITLAALTYVVGRRSSGKSAQQLPAQKGGAGASPLPAAAPPSRPTSPTPAQPDDAASGAAGSSGARDTGSISTGNDRMIDGFRVTRTGTTAVITPAETSTVFAGLNDMESAGLRALAVQLSRGVASISKTQIVADDIESNGQIHPFIDLAWVLSRPSAEVHRRFVHKAAGEPDKRRRLRYALLLLEHFPTSKESQQIAARTREHQTARVRVLSAISLEDREVLEQLFQDAEVDAGSRMRALKALVALQEDDEVPMTLVRAVNEGADRLRVAALEAIGERGVDSLLDEVIPLVDHESEEVALAAVETLTSMGGNVVEHALVAGLESQSEKVRARVTDALAEMNSRAAEPQLIDMLSSEDTALVHSAAAALARLGSGEAIEVLRTVTMMSPDDTVLAELAEKSIKQIQNRGADSPPVAEEPGAPDGPGDEHIEVDGETGGDDEFSLTLDPDLFGSND